MSNTFLSPSFDDEPVVDGEDVLDDDELTDDNRPIERRG